MALSHDLLRNGPTRLRTLEPHDVDWLMRWENAPEHWAVSGTVMPYSKAALVALCAGHQDLYTAGQLRWIIDIFFSVSANQKVVSTFNVLLCLENSTNVNE